MSAVTGYSFEHPGVAYHLTGSDMWDQRPESRLLCINVCAPAPAGRQREPGLPTPDLMGLLRSALFPGKVLEAFYQFY